MHYCSRLLDMLTLEYGHYNGLYKDILHCEVSESN